MSDPTFNPVSVLGDSLYLDGVVGTIRSLAKSDLDEKTTTINQQIVNLSDATSARACPSQPITSGYTTSTNSISFTDPVNGTVTITSADDVNDFQNFLLLNPSMRPTTTNMTNYGEPGGFGSADPFAANGWYSGQNPSLGYSGRTAGFFTPCTGLTPSTYDAYLQTDVSNGVYGCHFTWDFGQPVNWSSVKFYTNSGLVIFPVFTPRWVFFFGSNDGTTWTQFTPPQTHDYPFPGSSYYQVAVNNLEYTYTFNQYNTAYRYYRIAVASAGTGYFYLSSVQWISNGQFSSSTVATNSLSDVSVGTSNKKLNLQTNDLRINNTPIVDYVDGLNAFGTNAASTVSVGKNTQVLNLSGSSVNVNGISLLNTTRGFDDFGTTAGATVDVGVNTQVLNLNGSTVSLGASGNGCNVQGVANPITLGGALSDEITTLTTSNRLTIRAPFAFNIRSGALPYWWVNTLPTSTTPITFDILKNGTSIYSTKPTLSSTATNNSSQNGTLTTNPTSFAVGDLIVAQVSTVGSGTPTGAKVVIFNS